MNLPLTIISTILVFGVIILIHELGHFLTALAVGIKVNEFSIGMGPQVYSWGKKGITYSLRAFPIGGYVSMEGEDNESSDGKAFCNTSIGRRILVVVAGATMNIILGAAIILLITSRQDLISTTIVADFTEESTSSQVLQKGDNIVSVNNRKVHTVNNIGFRLMQDNDGLVDFVVIRDGKKLELENVPFDMVEVQEGINTIKLDFIVYGTEPTFTGVFKESYYWTTGIMEQVYVSFVDLVSGKYGLNQLSGPVGVSEVIGEAASNGLSSTMMMVALLSINIGIFNLLPLPALDGGRLFFLIIEAIFRRRIPAKYEVIINTAGIVALMGLMVVVTFNDILKLF